MLVFNHITLLSGVVSIYSPEDHDRILRRSSVILAILSLEAFVNFIPEANSFLAENENTHHDYDEFHLLNLMNRCSLYSRIEAATYFITKNFCRNSPAILGNLNHAIGVRNAATHSKPDRVKADQANFALEGKRSGWINHLRGQGVISESDYTWKSINQLVESRAVTEWVIQCVFDYFDYLVSETSPNTFLLQGFHPDPPNSEFINIYKLAKEEFTEKCSF